jgi:chromosome partitioning protein
MTQWGTEMKTIVVTSLKGGSGKSTICVNLAVEAEKQGYSPVALVDTDSPQGSVAHWWNVRESASPLFASDIRNLEGVALLIVDTAPQVPQEKTIQLADFVIIPVRPSPNDLRAVGETLAVVRKLDKDFCFVINAVKPRTNIAVDTLRVLAQYGKVAPVMLGDRVDFASSMIEGRTVSEINSNSKSSHEVAELCTYVSTQFNN